MADYDLGNARGTVEVDYDDRGIKEAEKSFKKLEQISARLDKALSGTKRAAINFGRTFRDMNGGMGGMVRNMQTARSAINSYVSVVTRAQRSSSLFTSEIRRISNGISLVRGLGAAFGLLTGADVSKLSPLTQLIVGLNSGIQMFKMASAHVGLLASKFAFLGAAGAKLGHVANTVYRLSGMKAVVGGLGTAFGFLGAKLGGLLPGIKMFGSTMAMIFPSLNKVGHAASAMGANFGLLGQKLMHFKGTGAIVNKTLRDTFKVTESVARNITKLAFFGLNLKTAWQGFAALGRIVAKAAFMFGSAITVAVHAISILGTAVAGTLNGLKVMSGTFMILPGIIAIAAAAFAVFKIGTKGVGDAMKAVMGDAEAFETAIKGLSPAAQSTMKAFRKLKPAVEEIQKSVQDAMFSGLAEEIDRVAKPALDAFGKGAVGVGHALGSVGKEVIGFAGKTQTLNDMGSIFKSTNLVIRNMAQSMSPLLTAITDIATVGAGVFAEMTSGMGSATERFAQFIRTARESGQIETWIRNGVQAFRDFASALGNIKGVIKEVFSQFGVSGDNAMGRFEAMTARFSAWFHEVSNGGEAVGSFADRLNSISDRFVTLLAFAWERLGDSISGAVTWFEKVTNQVDGGVRTAIDVLNGALEVLGFILGAIADPLAALVAGFITSAIAMKAVAMLGPAFKPLAAGISVVGTAAVATGKSILTMINAFATAGTAATVAGVQMGRFGTGIYRLGTFIPFLRAMQVQFMQTAGAVSVLTAMMGVNAGVARTMAVGLGLASAAAVGMRKAMSAAFMLIGGPAGAAALGLMVAIMALVNGFGATGTAARLASEDIDAAAKSQANLAKAFAEGGGLRDAPEVFDAIATEVETMFTRMDKTAEEMPSFWDKFSAIGTDVLTLGKGFGILGDSSTIAVQKTMGFATVAEQSKKVMGEMGISQDVLTSAMQKGGTALDDLSRQISGYQPPDGDWGEFGFEGYVEASEEVGTLITQLHNLEASYTRMGDSVQVTAAINTIADASSSASDKLGAMKDMLVGLGIIDTSVTEAMFAVTETIKEVGEAANSFPNDGSAFVNELGTGFETTSQNSAALFAELSKMAGTLQNVASTGGDVNAAYAQMEGTLDLLGNTTDLGRQKIDDLGRIVGLAPKELSIAANVVGRDQAVADIARVGLEMMQLGAGDHTMNLQVNSQVAVDALRKFNVEAELVNADTHEYKITGNVDDVNRVLEYLKTTVDPTITGLNPTVTPKLDPNQFNSGMGGVTGAVDGLDGSQPQINPLVDANGQTLAQINEIRDAATDPIPPMNIEITAPGTDVVREGIAGLQGVVVDTNARFQEFATGVQTSVSNAGAAVDTAAGQISGTLDSTAGGASNSGAALGQGFADGINSKIGEVQAAANALAAAASAPLPNSPAKTGPFSGRGWTPFRGMALAEGFAEGIEAGAPLAANASLGMVGQVSAAIDSLNSMFGQVQSQYNANTDVSNTKFIRTGQTNEELRIANEKKVAERIASDERSALKSAQQEAKDAVKKAAEPAKEEKDASPEQIAKDEAKTAEEAADARYKRAMQILQEGVSSEAEIADSVGALREKGMVDSDELAQAIAIAGNGNSSDADVIRSLQQIEAAQARTGDIETQDELQSIEDAIKSRRGIEEYDPFAEASKDIQGDVVKIGQTFFGLFDQIKGGLDAATSLATLLIRGISSTDDITAAVDGFQDVANGVMGLVSSVSDVASTVGGIAASFGQMIPGLGAFIGGVGMLTGALGSANAIIDLVQTGFDVLGSVAGGIMSRIAGGKDGALMGNIRTLVDTNDKTIKRWSDNDPTDKRSTAYGKGGPAKNTAVENLNIYQGPGQDPYRMVEQGMFAVRAYSAGVY